jgi:hypothetical protein
MLLTLKNQKSHTPSITIVIITVYLKENDNKKNDVNAQSFGILQIITV